MNPAGEWDAKRLEQLCWPYEISAIVSMSRDGRIREDKHFWTFDEKGQYTVKSGYLVEVGFYESPPQAAAYDKKYWLLMVWSLKLPSKTRVFMWRALQGFIPVDVNLLRHHVPTNGICQQCGQHFAYTEHCLIYCKKIKETWKRRRFWQHLKKWRHMGFNKICENIQFNFSKMDYEVWVLMLWQVWTYICKFRHEEFLVREHIFEEQGRTMWQTFQEARDCMENNVFLGIQPGDHRWHPPTPGTFRVDVDALFNESRNKFGVGVVVRDGERRIMAALAQPIPHPGSCSRGEVTAILYGIMFCFEQMIYPITIYSDSIIAVRAMSGLDEEEDLIPMNLRNIAQMASKDCILGIFHAYRSATKAAHHVAQFSVHISQPMSWRSVFPDWLVDVASVDEV